MSLLDLIEIPAVLQRRLENGKLTLQNVDVKIVLKIVNQKPQVPMQDPSSNVIVMPVKILFCVK